MANSEEKTYTSSELLESVYKFQLSKREIILNGVVDDSVIEKVVMPINNFNAEDDELEAELKNYNREDNPITLYLNTPGGYCLPGLSVVSTLKTSRTPVHTVALGSAMSMGFMILIAGHRRFCQPYTWMMYHQLSGGAWGTYQDMQEQVEHSAMLQDMMEGIVLENTLITEDILESYRICKSDFYMDAMTALDLGVVDEILTGVVSGIE